MTFAPEEKKKNWEKKRKLIKAKVSSWVSPKNKKSQI